MEIWKDVVGYEGIYKVSSLGRVKSFMFNKEKILKNQNMSNGYLFVNLFNAKKPTTKLIHQIMHESFYGIKSCRKYVIENID